MKTRMIACLWMLAAVSLMAQDKPQNVLKNPGFEAKDGKNDSLPADWGIFCEKGDPTAFKLVTENPKEGSQALKMGFDTSAAKFYGIGQRLPIKPGQSVTFTANFRNMSLRDETYVQISIEWINNADPKKEISRSWGPTTKATDVSTDSWKKFEVTAVAPPESAEMNIVITLFPVGSPDGAILVDDLNVSVKDAVKPAAPPAAQ